MKIEFFSHASLTTCYPDPMLMFIASYALAQLRGEPPKSKSSKPSKPLKQGRPSSPPRSGRPPSSKPSNMPPKPRLPGRPKLPQGPKTPKLPKPEASHAPKTPVHPTPMPETEIPIHPKNPPKTQIPRDRPPGSEVHRMPSSYHPSKGPKLQTPVKPQSPPEPHISQAPKPETSQIPGIPDNRQPIPQTQTQEHADSSSGQKIPKKLGRPPGSKNKPKQPTLLEKLWPNKTVSSETPKIAPKVPKIKQISQPQTPSAPRIQSQPKPLPNTKIPSNPETQIPSGPINPKPLHVPEIPKAPQTPQVPKPQVPQTLDDILQFRDSQTPSNLEKPQESQIPRKQNKPIDSAKYESESSIPKRQRGRPPGSIYGRPSNSIYPKQPQVPDIPKAPETPQDPESPTHQPGTLYDILEPSDTQTPSNLENTQESQIPRKRGRPPGSKNKPKPLPILPEIPNNKPPSSGSNNNKTGSNHPDHNRKHENQEMTKQKDFAQTQLIREKRAHMPVRIPKSPTLPFITKSQIHEPRIQIPAKQPSTANEPYKQPKPTPPQNQPQHGRHWNPVEWYKSLNVGEKVKKAMVGGGLGALIIAGLRNIPRLPVPAVP